MLQGPVVYGAKIEDRFKATDKVKVLLASATLMNKAERHMPREQAFNHSVETRIKAGDDDRLAVSNSYNLIVNIAFCVGNASLSVPVKLTAAADNSQFWSHSELGCCMCYASSHTVLEMLHE